MMNSTTPLPLLSSRACRPGSGRQPHARPLGVAPRRPPRQPLRAPRLSRATATSAAASALTQTLSAERPVASGRIRISASHVDMGPRFNNGKFELMLHDHGETPVWRSLDEVIYRGSDKAILRCRATALLLRGRPPALRCT